MKENDHSTLKIGGHRRGAIRITEAVLDEDIARQIEEKGWNYTLHSADYGYRWQPVGKKRQIRYLHRDVMELAGKKPGKLCVDHKNGDPLDCRLENLRLVSRAENAQNVRRRKKAGSSKFRGVQKTAKGWLVQVKGFRFGIFDDEVKAALKAHQVREDLMPMAEPDPELVKLFGDDLEGGFQMRIPGFE